MSLLKVELPKKMGNGGLPLLGNKFIISGNLLIEVLMFVKMTMVASLVLLLSGCDSRGPCEDRGTSCTGEALCEGYKTYHFAAVGDDGQASGESKGFQVNNVPGSQAQARACAQEQFGTAVISVESR